MGHLFDFLLLWIGAVIFFIGMPLAPLVARTMETALSMYIACLLVGGVACMGSASGSLTPSEMWPIGTYPVAIVGRLCLGVGLGIVLMKPTDIFKQQDTLSHRE